MTTPDVDPPAPPGQRAVALVVITLVVLLLAGVRPSRPGPNVAIRLDLNLASRDELTLLPRIGPALAARIESSRAVDGPFRSIADLDRVSGIGPRTIDALEAWVRVDRIPVVPSP